MKTKTIEFPVWKKIWLGVDPKTADEFRKILKRSSFHLSNWAAEILDQPDFMVSSEELELELVLVTIEELGLSTGATHLDIYARVQELGLELAPAEAGPVLRLQYSNQPKGEYVLVGMDPITDSNGYPSIFCIAGHASDRLWLSARSVYPDRIWKDTHLWVFVKHNL